MLSLVNARAAPWGTPLLMDVSLELGSGDILAVLGPNGAGKSTLLNLLGGGIRLAGGSLRLGSIPLAAWPREARACAVALLHQRASLAFPFVVRDVVALGRIPHATGQVVDAGIVDDAMRALDIAALAQRAYTELSGGEQQRVQLARVLAQVWRAQDSALRLLLLDEPGSALDLAHLDLLGTCLRRLAAGGCTVVFVAHDFNFASGLADRALFLRAGRAVAQGTLDAVFRPEVFHAAFGVRPFIQPHPRSGRPLVFAP